MKTQQEIRKTSTESVGEVRGKITEKVDQINDIWVLKEILRFIINITK